MQLTDRVIDLTQPLSSRTPTFDGNPESFHYQVLSSIEKDGCACGALRVDEHFGTHMDAPVHFVEGGIAIDQISAERFVLSAVVMDVRNEVKKDSDYRVSADEIQIWEKEAGISLSASAFLLMTGWDERYKNPESYCNRDEQGRLRFPGYSAEAAEYLVKKGIAMIGIDTLSVDYGLSEDFAVHKAVLGNDVYIIENLCDLKLLPKSGAMLFCGPLPIEGGTGSPARILAMVPS